ncbi:hypothetical protein KC365_g15099 [Hortaea werneckii]|nr:hypothetical protein KC339_g17007 [Hortaea werneckii]KAI7211030.1 hypothetical protein KC365_g15099 [Hortaea werneckii]
MPSTVRNQVAGDLDSRTYQNNYQDQRITLDVGSLMRRQATEDTLIRKLNDMGTNADPDANVVLPPEALEHIASLPDIASLQSPARQIHHHRPCTGVRNVGGSKTAHRTRKEFHKARIRAQLRKDFSVQKNAAIIEAQLSSGCTFHGAGRAESACALH